MTTTANKIIDRARYFVGFNESNGGHIVIIDIYNANRPLNGYKMDYDGQWCAAFVSACAVKCNATDIIPVDCHCNHMISLFKEIGSWIEDENIIPKPGDIVFYDWNDKGDGDNTGSADHVGIVEEVDYDNKIFIVIEGNYKRSVKRRTMKFNNKNLRGFARPDYIKENVSESDEIKSCIKSFANKCKMLAYRIRTRIK